MAQGTSESPPVGASAAELLSWFEKHEKALKERGALEPLLPLLGDVIRVEVVDGKNPTYPELTFDYAVHLADGHQLAIEVTQIVLPDNEMASREANRFGKEIEGVLRGQKITGRWTLSFLGPIPIFKQLNREEWLAKMQSLSLGERTNVDGCDMWRHFSDEPLPGDIRILTGTGYNHRSAESEMRSRFADAIDSNAAKLEAASSAGFDETHLIAWHIPPGDTDAWGEEAAARATQAHPQHVWVLTNFSEVIQLT